ncbi:MAG TPA: SAF domain-containing protein [Mycobacteriales bacterium]|nr:SAF domain-containing protein [Mycobacteriales bacterium]
MTDLPTTPAHRLSRPAWFDPRLVLGVCLVLVAVVVGARTVGAADNSTLVWAAAHDLSPGELLGATDLTPVRVRLFGAAGSYVSADHAFPGGYVVLRPVGAHELVPVGAVAPDGTVPDTRVVAVPVTSGHYDEGLAPGAVVDVYVTPRDNGAVSAAGPTRLVLPGVTVTGREGGARGFNTVTSTVTILLAVPTAAVPQLIRALEIGDIDLVDVPATLIGRLPGASS